MFKRAMVYSLIDKTVFQLRGSNNGAGLTGEYEISLTCTRRNSVIGTAIKKIVITLI